MSTPNPTPKQHTLPHRLLSKIPVSLRLLATSTTGSFLLGITGLWHQWMPTLLLACLIGPSLLPSSQDTLTHRCRRALAAITGAPLGLLLAGDALQASGVAPTEIQEVGLRMGVYLFGGAFAFDRLVESNSKAPEYMAESIKSIGMPLLGGAATYLLALDLRRIPHRADCRPCAWNDAFLRRRQDSNCCAELRPDLRPTPYGRSLLQLEHCNQRHLHRRSPQPHHQPADHPSPPHQRRDRYRRPARTHPHLLTLTLHPR